MLATLLFSRTCASFSPPRFESVRDGLAIGQSASCLRQHGYGLRGVSTAPRDE
jgi:hypothetical protein